MKDPYDIGIQGSCTALITPFHADGSIDEQSLTQLVCDTVEGNINFLCVLGTTAETPTLTPDEQQRVRDIVVRTVDGRRPLLLGYGSNSTADVIRRMQTDTFEGIDALLVVAPYYNKPSQEGLYRHFRAISEASPLPLVLYNVPGRTGVNMTADTTLRIARDCHNVIGVKEASGNLEQIRAIIDGRPTGFRVLCGDDKLTCPVLRMGGDGVISVVSNLFPVEVAAMTRAMQQGNEAEAAAIERRLLPWCDMLFAEGSPSGVKAALSLTHRCEEVLRLPLVPVSDTLREQMRTSLA